jgi:hypothetical protein
VKVYGNICVCTKESSNSFSFFLMLILRAGERQIFDLIWFQMARGLTESLLFSRNWDLGQTWSKSSKATKIKADLGRNKDQ